MDELARFDRPRLSSVVGRRTARKGSTLKPPRIGSRFQVDVADLPVSQETMALQLVEICKGYMKHEHNLLLAVTEARSHVQDAREGRDISGLGHAETEMRQSLQNLFIKVEAYPELKANENFLALQERISVLEDTIADRREIYNESVRLNNTRIQQFPDMLVARSFNFVELKYLRFKESDLQPVTISGLYD